MTFGRIAGSLHRLSMSRSGFLVGVTAVSILLIVHIVGAFTINRLGFDSAYNLTVSRNLIDGLGYASDGVIGDESLTPYDVRVTTGPTVLIPLSVAFLFGDSSVYVARSLMLIPYFALLTGLALVGFRLSGKWGALLAVAAPLTINVFLGTDWAEYQGPTDVLGEVPAAAMLIWALLTSRRFPYIASLLIGLAVLTKSVVILSVPLLLLVLVSWLLRDRQVRSSVRQVLLRSLVYCGLIALPSLMWEAKKLQAFGLADYLANVATFVRFFKLGSGLRENTVHDPIPAVRGLMYMWGLPPAVVVVVLLLLVFVAGMWFELRQRTFFEHWSVERHESATWVIFAILNFGLWAYWWTFITANPWSRTLLPALFVCVPILLASTVGLLRYGVKSEASVFRGVCVSLTVAMVVLLPLQIARNVARALEVPQTLSGQVEIVDAIHETGATSVNYVGLLRSVVAVTVLANVGAIHTSSGESATFPMLMSTDDTGKDAISTVDQYCGEVLRSEGTMTLCAPPN